MRVTGRLRVVAIGGAIALVVGGHALALRLPDDRATPLVFATHLYTLLVAAATLLLAAGVGRAALRHLDVAPHGRLERLLLSIALGLGLVANVVLVLGLLGLLQASAIAATLIGVALLVGADLGRVVHELPDLIRALRAARSSLRSGDRVLALLIPLGEVLVLVVLVQALAPPIGYDALMYHLHGSKRFLELGRLALLPDVQQANMPFTIDLLYLVGLAFGSDSAANVLHLSFALLTTAATFHFGRTYLGERVGWIAAATMLSTTLFSVYAPLANIDYGLALFDFLAVLAFARWLTDRRPGWLVVAGSLVGFALGSKYLGALTGFGLGVALLAMWLRSARQPRDLVMWLAAYGVPAALFAAPWYVKNLLWLGSPVWPFLTAGPPDVNIALMAHANFGRDLLDYLRLPFLLYWEGSLEHPDARPPLLLLLLPLYLLVRRHRVVTALLALAMVHVVVWASSAHVLRYLTAIMPELCLASAYVLVQLARSFRRGSAVASGLVVACMLMVATVNVIREIVIQPFGYLVGIESRQAYLSKLLPNHELVTYLNGRDDVRGVLLLGDRRAFYVHAPTWVDVSANEFRALATAPDADRARSELARLGVSHVLVSEEDIEWHARWSPDGEIMRWWLSFQALSPEYLAPVKVGESQTAYRVMDAAEAQLRREDAEAQLHRDAAEAQIRRDTAASAPAAPPRETLR